MSLRLLRPPEPDPLPTGALLVRDERRPGELHDVVKVDEAATVTVAEKAARVGVSVGVALTVLVEVQLLDEDMANAGLRISEPPPATTLTLRMSAAEATYLRALILRRPLKAAITSQNVAVPVRLLTRMTRETITRAAEADLERAIRWEVAALRVGRTIGELGLLLALRASGDD